MFSGAPFSGAPYSSVQRLAAVGGANSAAVAATEDNDVAAGLAGQINDAAVATTESLDVAAGVAGQINGAAVAATEANDTAAGAAGAINTATVAATEAADVASASAGPVAFADVPFGGAAWSWPKSRRDRRYVDDVDDVEPQTAPEHVAPPIIIPSAAPKPVLDIASILKDTAKTARIAAKEQAALNKLARIEIAVVNMKRDAQARADAAAKAEADEEDDLEGLLLMTW